MLPRWSAACLLAAVATFPLAGAMLAGRDLREVFQFPPALRIPVDYPRWSWVACALVLAPFVALGASWLAAGGAARRPRSNSASPASVRRRFPTWGWVAVAWTLAWWHLAWTRWPSFEPWQPYTFFPLWLGFVITVNALTQRATGTCAMRADPRGWLRLFAGSALFWWGFEWLNRFVLNWHYLAVERFGAVSYALHATLCFSTVLPAVAAIAEYLAARPGLQAQLAAGPAWRSADQRATGIVLLAFGVAGLVCTGFRPREFYAALWAAPLALLLGIGIAARRDGIWTELTRGDWRRTGTFALAALVCGFFWELWNLHSLAKWIYTVPYADRWHLFEMPALGYLGYLPFGLECLLVIECLTRAEQRYLK